MSTYYVQQQEGTCAEFNYDIYCIPTAEGKEAPDVACWGSSGVAVFKNNGNEEAAKPGHRPVPGGSRVPRPSTAPCSARFL